MISEWKQKVVRSFDDCAEAYEQYSTIQKSVAEMLAQELPDYDAPDILEIGCGTGFLTQHIFRRYPQGRFHITDIAPRMLEIAREKTRTDGQNVTWFVMDGENPETNQRYDLIVSSMSFQWFEDVPWALERLRHVLKPGGCVLYAMPGPDTFQEWRAALNEHQVSSGLLNFAKPDSVFKEEQTVIDYGRPQNFLKHLKKTGAHVPRQGYQSLTKTQLSKVCDTMVAKSQGKISWHILYGRLEA